MSSVKKGYLVPTPQWTKHLRKFWRRVFWKRQRRADKRIIKDGGA